MKLKRTGWRVVFYKTLVDIFPLDDLQEHLMGDECWCNPDIIQEPGYKPRISHNSLGRREEEEPDHGEYKLFT